MLGGWRSIPKSISGGRSTERLSEWTDFNSALAVAVVVFVVPRLSRGNPSEGGQKTPKGVTSETWYPSDHVDPLRGNGATPEPPEFLGPVGDSPDHIDERWRR